MAYFSLLVDPRLILSTDNIIPTAAGLVLKNNPGKWRVGTTHCQLGKRCGGLLKGNLGGVSWRSMEKGIP